MLKNKDSYLKIILTVIAVLLVFNIIISWSGVTDTKAYAVGQSSEFQEQFKFILGPKSNIRGNLMVLEYPGKGIYYINLDNVNNFFEGKEHIEFTTDGKKFRLKKPKYNFDMKTDENTDADGADEHENGDIQNPDNDTNPVSNDDTEGE